jgi:hypothetical protein
MTEAADDFGPVQPVAQDDDFGPVQPIESDDMGVVSMPAPGPLHHTEAGVMRELHARAAARAAGNALPPESSSLAAFREANAAESPDLTAFKASRAGVDPASAAQALSLAKQTGLDPGFVAGRLPQVAQAQDDSATAASLARSPITADYASQSAVHAAAVQKDVGIWEALEQGFKDVGYGLLATEQMSFPSEWGQRELASLEEGAAEMDRRHAGVLADLARSGPTIATFMLASTAGKAAGTALGAKAAGPAGAAVGGTAGELSAVAATMYALNRGSLYRRIMQQAPPEGTEGFDPAAYESRARLWATTGGLASAAIGAGLSTAVSLAVPGAGRRIQGLSTSIIAKAFADPVMQATINGLSNIGAKTLTGALMMAVPAALDDVTVQKAVNGQADIEQAAEAGWQAFKKSLLAAGVLSSMAHGPALLRDVGAAHTAKAEQARLDTIVKNVQSTTLAKTAPAEAESLLGKQASGSEASTVYIDHEAASRPAVAEKLIETLADEGQALAEAKATMTAVPVPVEKYAVNLGEQHGSLRDDVKLSYDGMTAREASAALPELDAQIAALREPFTVEKLNAIAQRGMGKAPTETEINDALGQLRSLGFQVEDVPKVVAGGTADEPGAAGGAGGATPPSEPPRASEPAPEPPPDRSESYSDRALAMLEAKPIGEIQPGRYKLAAEQAADRITKAQAAAIERLAQAGEIAQEGIGTATASAEAARSGAESLVAGKTLAAASEVRGAGKSLTKSGQASIRESERGQSAAERASQAATRETVRAGDRLLSLPDLTEARDLSRALAKHAAAVREEMDSAQKYILDRATPEKFAALAKAGPEYEGAFRGIVAALGDGQGADPTAVDILLARMERDAEPVAFDPDRVRTLLAQPKDWEELKPTEARNLLDAVKNIRAAAKRSNEIAIADRRQSVRDFVSGVRAKLDEQGVPDSGLPAPSRASAGPLDRAGQKLSAISAEMLQPREILRRLGAEAIYDDFVRSRNYREELAQQVGEHIYRAYEQMPAELKKVRFDGIKGPGSPVVADDLWTRQDAWNLLAWMGNEGNKQRALDGLRITEDQARDFLGQLGSSEVRFVESLHRLNDEKLWPLIRDHTQRVTGTSPPKVEASPFTLKTADGEVVTMPGGYWPARQEPTAARHVPEAGDGTIAGYQSSLRDGFSGTARYFTKERAAQATYRPDLNWSMYAGHVNSVLQYLAFDDFTRNVGRVFTDAEFRDLVKSRLGPQEIQELDKFLSVASRGSVEGAQDGARTLGQVVGSGFRSRVATAAFGLNLPVVIGQLSHIPAAMFGLRIGPLDMAKAVGLSFSSGSWSEAHSESQQLPYRWNGFGSKMRELVQGVGPNGDRATVRKWIDAASYATYHGMDGFLSKTIYEAAKTKAERAGASPADAIKAGDQAVATMMPPLNIAEQSSFARDRGVIGSLLLVRNFPNVLYNVGAMNAWQARTAVWQSSPGMQRVLAAGGATALAAGSYLGMTLSAHLFGRFMMGHGQQDDETAAQYAERMSLAAPFYPLPFGEDVAAPIADAFVREQSIKTAFRAAPSIALLEDGIKDLGKVLDSNRDDADRVIAGMRLSARALQLPTSPLKPLRYGYDLEQGNVRPRGPFDIAGGFTYGQRDRQPKNPFTEAQDLISGE